VYKEDGTLFVSPNGCKELGAVFQFQACRWSETPKHEMVFCRCL